MWETETLGPRGYSDTVTNEGRANCNGKVCVTGKVKVANHTTKDSTIRGFKFINDLQCPRFWSTRQCSRRESCLEDINRCAVVGNLALNR